MGMLSANLSALEKSHPDILRSIESAEHPSWLEIVASRDGSPTAIARQGTETISIHSRYAPSEEAARLVSGVPRGSTVVLEGVGLGYHLEALLGDRDPFAVLVLEPSVALLHAALSNRDLSSALADPRVSIAIDPQEADLRRLVAHRFRPFFSRRLHTVSLLPWARMNDEWFARRREWVQSAAEDAISDFAVQCRFGLRWIRNSVLNLIRQETPLHSKALSPCGPKAVVTAAGPSLGEATSLLKKGGAHLVATDTSLPFLASIDRVPDELFSIDCQQVSYHHFFGRIPTTSLALFEAASPPSLLRRVRNQALFLGEHPLHVYLERRMPGALRLDTSGGNVTFTVVDYLRRRGCREIKLFGADFGYPSLQSYANPSFLQHHFRSRSSRLAPLESHLCAFALDRIDPSTRTTKLLAGYRQRLFAYCRSHGGRVEEAGPGTLVLRFPEASPSAASGGVEDVVAVLRAYRGAIEKVDISAAVGDLRSGVHGSEALELLLTILPTAAAFSVAHPHEEAHALLDRARAWTADYLYRMLP